MLSRLYDNAIAFFQCTFHFKQSVIRYICVFLSSVVNQVSLKKVSLFWFMIKLGSYNYTFQGRGSFACLHKFSGRLLRHFQLFCLKRLGLRINTTVRKYFASLAHHHVRKFLNDTHSVCHLFHKTVLKF